MDKVYVDTVRLLLEAAPEVFRAPHFALKGGTALNLFIQDMPRLSVDIDVVYTDHHKSRAEALAEIGRELNEVGEQLKAFRLDAQVTSTKDGDETKLLVRSGNILVKVEVNHVFRGTLLSPEPRRLVERARSAFTMDVVLPVLATPEVYGGKLVAAMDRQHPRDLYDVRAMYASNGLTPQIIECFVCYLAGHNRPIHEVLFSRDLAMDSIFEEEIQGMTREDVPLSELVLTRSRLRKDINEQITDSQKQFLVSLANADPDWSLIPIIHLQELPAIRWKLQNLQKLKKSTLASSSIKRMN
ncbi:nucleotidyl transferase AbiEii/AbiGii toxin family protein [Phragmitibacter flavus]|uniref:nucleotidyl transferase AbiEii/AbiGii toxin family protein n=1 Tax=Phragmitibacter flavus TaxID=2576071 RepID=UPI0019814F85|nr:nucleotidyl transferase AbiEii/AbiGii toxin family protein [Phragmitibacter flavus]